MNMIISVDKNNIVDLTTNNDVYVFMVKQSRIKAKQIAIYEILFGLTGFGATFITNGPLGDVKGVISFFVKKGYDERVFAERLNGLGYVSKCYKLELCEYCPKQKLVKSINEYVWKGKPFDIKLFFEQNQIVYENQSSHNREFYILDENNEEKRILGYRGDGTELGRRALPVEDCRCLVNLSMLNNPKTIIDPFAGSGGILFQAKYINSNLELYSVDIDPVVSPGLERISHNHFIGKASEAIFEDVMFDAIVTEVPFSITATNDILDSFFHLINYLSNNSLVVVMNAFEQQSQIHATLNNLGLLELFSKGLNRKGTDVVINCFTNSDETYKKIECIKQRIRTIY